MTSLLVSLCIPTKGRPENIRTTLQSIVDEAVDPSQVQIVISDNSSDQNTRDVVSEFTELNIKYYRSDVIGFLNSIESLKHGDGALLKLQNDYSSFSKGGLHELVSVARNEIEEKPQIIFTGGSIGLKNGLFRSGKFDEFIRHSEYFGTWSTAYSVWKADLDHLMSLRNIEINDQFPHTSLLLNTIQKNKYLIHDRIMYNNQTVQRKGGYNIFYIFCVVYPKMLRACIANGSITKSTYKIVVGRMKYKFIARWAGLTLFEKGGKENYTFDSTNWQEHVAELYGRLGYIQIYIVARIFALTRSRVRFAGAK